MYKYEKPGIQKMIAFIDKLFANVQHFGFYIKTSSGHLICDFEFFEFYLIQLKKKKIKRKNILNTLMMVQCKRFTSANNSNLNNI